MTANLGLVEEGAVVGEDPVALLEGRLRRVLAFVLVLLLLLLVAAAAAAAARVGVGGAPHGFDSPLTGGEGSGAAEEGTGVSRTGERRGEEEEKTDGNSFGSMGRFSLI